jgi:toluene monooxygenase system ferredoxin subunit
MAEAEATITWVEVGTLDDIWEGELLEVDADGRPVLLMHLPGAVIVAYQGLCPHQEYSLADGDLDEDSMVVTCAAHAWQFDLRDGRGVNPSGCTLYRYETRVQDGAILVGYPDGDEQRYNRCRED